MNLWNMYVENALNELRSVERVQPGLEKEFLELHGLTSGNLYILVSSKGPFTSAFVHSFNLDVYMRVEITWDAKQKKWYTALWKGDGQRPEPMEHASFLEAHKAAVRQMRKLAANWPATPEFVREHFKERVCSISLVPTKEQLTGYLVSNAWNEKAFINTLMQSNIKKLLITHNNVMEQVINLANAWSYQKKMFFLFIESYTDGDQLLSEFQTWQGDIDGFARHILAMH